MSLSSKSPHAAGGKTPPSRRPQRRATLTLVGLAAMALAALAVVESSLHLEPDALYEAKVAAAELSRSAASELRRQRLERGVVIDPLNDPGESVLIGQEYTQITTDRGSIDAKIASTDPNFAAVAVEMLGDLGLAPGDCVAVAVTGSFPGLNISLYAALETLALRPAVVTSVGASNWGANAPDFTWLDMERQIAEAGLMTTRSSAASIGGGLDTGRGLSPHGRRLIREAIERNGVPYLAPRHLQQGIDRRLEVYTRECGGQPAAFVNVGGGVASLGHPLNGEFIPSGVVGELPRRNYPNRGVLLRLHEAGVPAIHLLRVETLARRHGLVFNPNAPSTIGTGRPYEALRYDLRQTLLATCILVATILFIAFDDRRRHRLGNEPVGLGEPQGDWV